MDNNGFSSSPIRTYKKQNKPDPLRTVLVLLMTVVIIAAIIIFITSLTGTGMFSDRKPSDKGEQTTPESTTPEVTTPEIPVDPNAVQYTTVNKTAEQIGRGDLLLINKDHLYKFTEGALLEDIYKVSPYFEVNGSKYQLKYSTVAQFKLLAQAFYNSVGKTHKLLIMDAYRDFDTQNGYHQSDPTGAVPAGASDYHSGSTVNLKTWNVEEAKVESFSSENGSNWLKQHAYEYGFVFRSAGKGDIVGYDIAWQLRYVGVPHSEYMYVNNLCLEEYLSLLSTNHRYVEGGKNNLVIECIDGNVYEVYYAEGTTEAGVETRIPVPSNKRYDISGDNMSGFIVTVLVQEGNSQENNNN